MQRRLFLTTLGATFLTTAHLSQVTAQQGDVHQQIARIALAMQVSLGLGLRDIARAQGMQIIPLTRLDPNWGNYGSSADVTHMLFRLTDPNNRAAIIQASQLVFESWNGINTMMPDSAENRFGVFCQAVYILLQNPDAFAHMRYPRGLAAALLLAMAGAASGPERQNWARVALRDYRLYGGDLIDQMTAADRSTGRWAAVTTAVAGDFPAAASQYELILTNAVGALNDVIQQNRAHNRVGGLAELVAGIPLLEAEAATAFALNGQFQRANDLLEQARATTLNQRIQSSTQTSGDSATELESRLTSNATVVVQVAATQIGAMALCSKQRAGRVQRNLVVQYESGGLMIVDRLVGYQVGLSEHRGLVREFDNIHRHPTRHLQDQFKAYVVRATTDAEDLIGSAIRAALRGAQVGAGADVLIIVPATLAWLPIGLARGQGEAPLAEAYQLRFADSLRSAWRSKEEARRHPTATSKIGMIAPSSSDSPPFAQFEREVVLGQFSLDRRLQPAAPTTAATALNSLQGADYWHIASHGAWDIGDPTRSGLRIVPGHPTTVTDVLSTRSVPAPRLVFLSACETDLINVNQDLNNFVGLQTAFLASGAAAVVGTQWPADDAAASLLAAKFYVLHVQDRLEPAAALRQSQTWLRTSAASDLLSEVTTMVANSSADEVTSESISGFLADLPGDQKPFEHPYYWGGYQLYGA